jgi:nucleoside 2-deoxyribosyltransferase
VRVVYIAGRFRGPHHWAIHEHIRAAERVAFAVWQAGAAALCPHLNTMHFQDALPDAVWLDGDLALLAKCDALMTVENWRESVGAQAEVAFAVTHGIPVFHELDALAQWLRVTQDDVTVTSK